jgi:hypothetical protein
MASFTLRRSNAEVLHGMAEIDDDIRAQFQPGPHGLYNNEIITFSMDGILAASIVYTGNGG